MIKIIFSQTEISNISYMKKLNSVIYFFLKKITATDFIQVIHDTKALEGYKTLYVY